MRLAIVFVLALSRLAAADDLVGQAAEAHAALRYDDALELLARAWQTGGNEPAQLRQLFALAGQAAASIGDDAAAAAAAEWFARWLCLEPDAVLPPGTSPKIAAVFAATRDKLGGAKLAARAIRRGSSIDVTIESDPAALVDTVQVGARRERMRGTQRFPAGEPIVLFDKHGNTLAIIAARDEVIDVARGPTPWYGKWQTYAIATAALAVAGGGGLLIALDARSSIRDLNAESGMHEFGEARSLEDRFDGAQLFARIAFAGAAVTAIIGGVFYMRERGESGVTIAPTGDGATASWSTRF